MNDELKAAVERAKITGINAYVDAGTSNKTHFIIHALANEPEVLDYLRESVYGQLPPRETARDMLQALAEIVK